MTAPVLHPAFADRIPAHRPPVLGQLAREALAAKQLLDMLDQAEPPLSGDQYRRLSNMQVETRDAFFAALEQQGIDPDLFRALGDL